MRDYLVKLNDSVSQICSKAPKLKQYYDALLKNRNDLKSIDYYQKKTYINLQHKTGQFEYLPLYVFSPNKTIERSIFVDGFGSRFLKSLN